MSLMFQTCNMTKSISVIFSILSSLINFAQEVKTVESLKFQYLEITRPEITSEIINYDNNGTVEANSYTQITDEVFYIITAIKYLSMEPKDSEAFLKGVNIGMLNTYSKEFGQNYKIETQKSYLFRDKYKANKSTGILGGTEFSCIVISNSDKIYTLLIIGNMNDKYVKPFIAGFDLLK